MQLFSSPLQIHQNSPLEIQELNSLMAKLVDGKVVPQTVKHLMKISSSVMRTKIGYSLWGIRISLLILYQLLFILWCINNGLDFKIRFRKQKKRNIYQNYFQVNVFDHQQ